MAKHKYFSKARRDKPVPEEVTEKAPEYTLTDPSNHLLTTGPSVLSCGVTEINGEQVLLMTVRTQSTTLTVALSYKEAASWLGELAYKVKAMQDAASPEEA